MKIVFFGTSHRSALFLEQAIQKGLKVDLVVSDPPKPVGKKQILTENPTVTLAKKLEIPILTSIFQLQDPASNFFLPTSTHTVGLILDFNKIIPAEIINLFPKGIINIHFSKLPQYKGPSPVQYTILNGDKDAWITYYLINEKVDAGLILKQSSLDLNLTENTKELYQKLIAKASFEIQSVIDNYLSDRSSPCQQQGTPSDTKKLTLENCKIDWSKTPQEIDRLIRAAYPEPGAWTEVKFQKNPSSRAKSRDPFPVARERDSPPDFACDLPASARRWQAGRTRWRAGSTPPIFIGVGRNDEYRRLKILKAHLENGKLILDQVQLEGKNPVTYKQFQEGHPSASFH